MTPNPSGDDVLASLSRLDGLPALKSATILSQALSHSLALVADPAAALSRSKIPAKVLLLRELYAYRLAELATSACDLFRDGSVVAATVLTRSALEVVAWLFSVDRKTRKCLENDAVGTLDEFLNRLLFGSRTQGAECKAYNVLDAIDEIDKMIPSFRSAYDLCSEFAHPNADGVLHSYGRYDKETIIFNLDPKKHQPPVDGIVPILAGGLGFFMGTYTNMASYLAELVALCEREIDRNA
ncbi:MAG: hypothetical protein HYR72_06900 [Deltaproteobacteria bacterium]|nr:hypothetical protein [Deltaproteobacteria bacterium]MBI3387174.1 hypothetical protein [Deltaproteobacteria bacterium]